MPMSALMDPINPAASLTHFKAAETAMRVQYAVMAKVLATANAQGEALVRLIESAAQGFEQAVARGEATNDPSRMLDLYA